MAKANSTPSQRMEAPSILKPIHNLMPIDLWKGCGGLNYSFEDTEEAIRKSGLVPDWMRYPGKGVRSCVRKDEPHFIKLSRLKEGRIRVWISADLVTSSDKCFRDFLGGLLADTRLSLVKGESA